MQSLLFWGAMLPVLPGACLIQAKVAQILAVQIAGLFLEKFWLESVAIKNPRMYNGI